MIEVPRDLLADIESVSRRIIGELKRIDIVGPVPCDYATRLVRRRWLADQLDALAARLRGVLYGDEPDDPALHELKKMLAMPPVLAALTEKEPRLLYIAATSRVVSTVIVVQCPEEGRAQPVQRPV